MSNTYLDATQEAGIAFYRRGIKGEVIMLNLLRFREKADYSNLPEIDPGKELSGSEAYQLYMELTLPFLTEAGSELIFIGEGGRYLIGPEEEEWDQVLLVKHQSVAKFMEFAQNPPYLKIAGHRKAALKDSRLLPISETDFP